VKAFLMNDISDGTVSLTGFLCSDSGGVLPLFNVFPVVMKLIFFFLLSEGKL
jgi:hypothetical protein